MKKFNLFNTKFNFKKIIAASFLLISLVPATVSAAGKTPTNAATKNISTNVVAKAQVQTTANAALDKKSDSQIQVGSIGNSNLFVKKLNAYRTANSLAQVKEDKKLNELALLRAQEELEQYINTGDGDHESPGGYNKNLGENLALSYYTLGYKNCDINEECLSRWIKSPGHNQNLLFKSAKKCGFASVRKVVNNQVYEASIYLFGI